MEICIHIPESGLEIQLYRLNKAGAEPAFEPITGPVPLALDANTIPKLVGGGQQGPYPEIGQKLLAALDQGAVGQEWRKLRTQWPADLKTYLCIENPDLASLPWETLTEQVVPLAAQASLLRCPGFPPLSQQPESPLWPLRIFVLNAANPADIGIQAREEVWSIRRALREAEHSVDLEVYETANDPGFNVNKLVESFKVWPQGPHILHVIGHSEAGKDPKLKLYVPPAAGTIEQGSYIPWTLAQIAVLVNKLPDLRLVYVNACRTNVAGSNPATPLSMANVFLLRAAAVIAMQADISGAAAVECAATFYTNLIKGVPPDVALKEARQTLLNSFRETARDTYAPVITTRVRAEDILIQPQLQWPAASQARWLNALEKPLKLFVDQRPHRRKLLPVLFDPPPVQRGAVIRGEEEVGKTWLLQWFAYVLARRGAQAHYIAVAGPVDWLEVVRRIRDGAGEPHTQGLDRDLQSEFNWKLNYLAGAKGASQAAPPYPPGIAEADRAGALPVILKKKALLNDFRELVCEAMAYALRQQAGRAPLALIFDSLSIPEFGILKSGLLEPLIRGAANIRVVICFDDRQWDAHKGLDFSGWEEIVVGPIEIQQAQLLIPELLRLQHKGDISAAEKWLNEMVPTTESMKVKDLNDMSRIIGRMKGLTWALSSSSG